MHHVAGFLLQHAGAGLVVFEDASPAFLLLVIHALFAVVECAVLSLVAHKSNIEGQTSIQLQQSVSQIVSKSGEICLEQEIKGSEPSLQHFSQMLVAVKELVYRVRIVADELSGFVNKVSGASSVLDSTVDEQNKQVSSISQAMREMTESIQAVAALSNDAHDFAANAKDKTSNTKTAIEASRSNISELKLTLQTTSGAIGDLSNKCQNIADVMQSIKSVAEQTNLLALNAAIESARAGEHGRGFAVVADEVRNLAIKSKDSAEEIEKITELLTASANHSVENMNNCVEMVNLAVDSSEQATHNMEEVIEGITSVNANVTKVAGSASEQATTSSTISQSAEHLYGLFSDEKTQVEKMKHDILQVRELTESLSAHLSKFRLSQ